MSLPTPPASRVRGRNAEPIRASRDYILYWSQMARRLDRNHALDFALARAAELGKPLVVYEGLKLGYPWASVRHHRFILEGMRDNARTARQLRLTYWPFVETPADSGRGLLRSLADRACLVVTDAYPAFIVPAQTAALAAKVDVAVIDVDSNGLIPLADLGPPASAAAHLRHRIHRAFADGWHHRASVHPEPLPAIRGPVDPPFASWDAETDLDSFLDSLPLDRAVAAVPGRVGGSTAGRARLKAFVTQQLPNYADGRNLPASLEEGNASGLSPYLHYGHVSMQEVAEAVLATTGDWNVTHLNPAGRGKRDGFFCDDANVNSFLDEAITWRDLGYHWHWHRHADTASLATALPDWAMATLNKHASDARDHLYSPEEWEAADTHDELWNAAQRELVVTGRIHNYLRMLWGKKVLEWSATPEEAYQVLVHLNNKYALDGRDPNSYTGILWTFGLFDRPWAPERKVFGSVRYMSSASTRRKFDLSGYLDYVAGLSEPPRSRGTLF